MKIRIPDIKEQDPVNIHAAEKMGELHDELKNVGYGGLDLEILLVRIVFCLFADDTGIFEKNLFRDYIEKRTRTDGSDLGFHLAGIFEVLNTSVENRTKNIDEELNDFPYVNGGLFDERIRIASFNSEMRNLILESSILDWGLISPAVFGSLFQSAMDAEERRILGAHYTSEENILKVIKPLFLDGLWSEFEKIKNTKTRRIERLHTFHNKLASLKILDPACGCGNFLIITYRELRLLELELLKEKLKGQFFNDRGVQLEGLLFETEVKIDVDQFYGIEIDEFASQIAQVALWLMDHQMNMKVSEEFGEYFVRLPLRKQPHIIHGNALKIDWEDIINKNELDFILGNPPFVGTAYMSKEQKNDLKPIIKPLKTKALDFVSGWFIKAANYVGGTKIKVGLVATNSIVQGLQALAVWKYIINNRGLEILFAHQTFQWTSEAKGKANVFCVIVGFGHSTLKTKRKLYSYQNVKGKPLLTVCKNINQYLLDAPTDFIEQRSKPIHNEEPMLIGTSPLDYGNYVFNLKEKEEFVLKEPLSEKYFKPYIGGKELINGHKRYILYLKDISPAELKKMPLVMERVNKVKEKRLLSNRKATYDLGYYPTKLAEDRYIESELLVIPKVSSGNRKYIPIGYFDRSTVCSDKTFQVPNASHYLFGVLSSNMHMAWMNVVGGRLKGDYSYSNTLVYNNFVFPEPSQRQKEEIERRAKKILDVRNKYTDSALADLYDPVAMPPDLMKAHNELDKAVEKAYTNKKFGSDDERVTYLFKLYGEYSK